MKFKTVVNVYNLCMALGAFFIGVPMFLGLGGFETFPDEWANIMPFSDWSGLALFGMGLFGIGNAAASIYGFRKKDKKLFAATFCIGAIFLLCTAVPTVLLGEWYLPTGPFFLLGIIQLLLGAIGFVMKA